MRRITIITTLILASLLMAASCSEGKRQMSAEQEMLSFLYKYMDIADIADYDSTFFLENIRISLKAREEMQWGKSVPEQLFRHFVLPVRVNNERLDRFRAIYYDTLKSRVQGLSMHDAALEINHWCHEKVTYTPSDARTSSPTASILNGEGRCGEESTFTVAAMRAVGIPARQVYTPRWAHTDDNHAWVEVWTDGKWSFLGACEPEAELDMAWFNEPAARAMLMHTLVFGDYHGTEDVIRKTHSFTEINVIGNYVKTRNNIVTVNNEDGWPVEGADVSFCIYNYGEFYPAVTLKTGVDGTVSLHSGLGDMLVWAVKDGKFGTGTLSGGNDSEGSVNECNVIITLDHSDKDHLDLDIDINPPAPGRIPAEASEAAIAANKIRLAQEDSIRNAYISTFRNEKQASGFIENIPGYKQLSDETTARAIEEVVDSKGNWREIESFLASADSVGILPEATTMLSTLSRKDLRDTKASVLRDALFNAQSFNRIYDEHKTYENYVLCPRVAGEFLQPYRQEIQNVLVPVIPQDLFHNSPILNFSNGHDSERAIAYIPKGVNEAEKASELIINWVRDNIELADSLNPRRLQCTPGGVLKLRQADKRSRDIFTVAALRTFGIPARIDILTGKAQYMTDPVKGWTDILFGNADGRNGMSGMIMPKGYLRIDYTPGKGTMDNPEYYRHFTLTRIDGGKRKLLEFEGGDATELGADASAKSFSKPFPLDTGTYMLTTGTRMASGKVLGRIVTFQINEGKITDVTMIMRQNSEEVSVIGSMNPEAPYLKHGNGQTSILSTTGRGYFIIAVVGSSDEPSNHALRDMDILGESGWKRPVLILSSSSQETERVQSQTAKIKGLANLEDKGLVFFGSDIDGSIRKMLCDGCHSGSMTLPVIAVCDSFGRIVYLSTGYNTSLASQLQNTVANI